MPHRRNTPAPREQPRANPPARSTGTHSPNTPAPREQPRANPHPRGSASAPAGPAAPAAPAAINPFLTPDDMQALSAFVTDYKTKIADLDFNLGNLETDTTLQKKQVGDAAVQNTAGAADDAAARGIFQSSIKDAALYDIEAQRALQSKFLDDKLTAARTNAGTQKQILADSKEAFDKAMAARQVENAQGVNDQNSSAWAAAMAAWQTANGVSTSPSTPAAPSSTHRPNTPAPREQPRANPPTHGAPQPGGLGPVNPALVAGAQKVQAGSAQKFMWPDGKFHSRPYQGR